MTSRFDAPDTQISGTSSAKDIAFWAGLDKILTEYPHSTKHILGHWPVYTKRVLLVRFLAHWELYKQIADLPGSILEMGVSRGVSLFSFYKFLEVTHPADTGRRAYGIDSFEGLTDFTPADGAETAGAAAADRQKGGWSAGVVEGELMALAELFNADNILARERIKIVKGRVQEALPKLLEETPGLRLSLVHFDMDLYEPTKFALECIWDRIVPGGILVFDEYAVQPWEGETRAVDEFRLSRGLTSPMRKIAWSPTPGAYFVKA
jgi:hypothetical protein